MFARLRECLYAGLNKGNSNGTAVPTYICRLASLRMKSMCPKRVDLVAEVTEEQVDGEHLAE
jgi:hypothetical protein